MKIIGIGVEQKFRLPGISHNCPIAPPMLVINHAGTITAITEFLERPRPKENLSRGGAILFVSGNSNYCGTGKDYAKSVNASNKNRVYIYPFPIHDHESSDLFARDIASRFEPFFRAIDSIGAEDEVPWSILEFKGPSEAILAAYLALLTLCNARQKDELWRRLSAHEDLWRRVFNDFAGVYGPGHWPWVELPSLEEIQEATRKIRAHISTLATETCLPVI